MILQLTEKEILQRSYELQTLCIITQGVELCMHVNESCVTHLLRQAKTWLNDVGRFTESQCIHQDVFMQARAVGPLTHPLYFIVERP